MGSTRAGILLADEQYVSSRKVTKDTELSTLRDNVDVAHDFSSIECDLKGKGKRFNVERLFKVVNDGVLRPRNESSIEEIPFYPWELAKSFRETSFSSDTQRRVNN